MTTEKQKKIAYSFSKNFEEFDIQISLSDKEFALLQKGFFSKSMDEKWNVFVLSNFLYLSRSWTDHCIYKVLLEPQLSSVILTKGFVTRNRDELSSENTEKDKILLLKLLERFLDRDDIYIDPAYHLDIIQQVLSKFHPRSRYKQSINRQSVSIYKSIYESLLQSGDECVKKAGWKDLHAKIENMDEDVEILSLYIHDIEKNTGVTYCFDILGNNLISTLSYSK